jgi:hypothetical protein
MKVGFEAAVACELPGIESEHWESSAEGEADFREGAVFAADSDGGLGGADDEDVTGFAEAGREGQVKVRVGLTSVEVGEESDGEAAGGMSASASGSHDPT